MNVVFYKRGPAKLPLRHDIQHKDNRFAFKHDSERRLSLIEVTIAILRSSHQPENSDPRNKPFSEVICGFDEESLQTEPQYADGTRQNMDWAWTSWALYG